MFAIILITMITADRYIKDFVLTVTEINNPRVVVERDRLVYTLFLYFFTNVYFLLFQVYLIFCYYT